MNTYANSTATITIKGNNFDAAGQNTMIYINETPATVVQVSDTVLVVTVPSPASGEKVGQISITTDAGKTTAAQELVLGNKPNANLSRSITVYPNPTLGRIKIDFSQAAVNVEEVEVLNSLGQKIVSCRVAKPASREELDLSEHGVGLYAIRLKTGRGIVTKKIIVR